MHALATADSILKFLYCILHTCLSDLCQRQHVWHDEGKDILCKGVWEEWEAEQEQVEDDEEAVKGDESDENLSKDRLQVHVTTVQHRDRQKVACNRDIPYNTNLYATF